MLFKRNGKLITASTKNEAIKIVAKDYAPTNSTKENYFKYMDRELLNSKGSFDHDNDEHLVEQTLIPNSTSTEKEYNNWIGTEKDNPYGKTHIYVWNGLLKQFGCSSETMKNWFKYHKLDFKKELASLVKIADGVRKVDYKERWEKEIPNRYLG